MDSHSLAGGSRFSVLVRHPEPGAVDGGVLASFLSDSGLTGPDNFSIQCHLDFLSGTFPDNSLVVVMVGNLH